MTDEAVYYSEANGFDITALFALDEPHRHSQNFVETLHNKNLNVPTVVVYPVGKAL